MKLSSEDALKILLDGNKRFIEQRTIHPHQDNASRKEQIERQEPFAIILGCSDSRVPPEIIFDQGIGDLFVIRVAGNVIDKAVVASAEYAVEHLGVSLLVVLGHGQCGAVNAVIERAEAHGNMESIIRAIEPAVEKAKEMPGDIAINSVKVNVQNVVEQLKASSPILSNNGLMIIGAFYDMSSGLVTFM